MAEETTSIGTILPGEETASTQPNPLGYAPVGKLLLTYSIPAIVQMLITSIYNIVDQVFIGQGVGYLGNAATTVAFPIMSLIMAFTSMIGTGGAALAAIRLGQKKEEVAQKALTNIFVLSASVGVVIAVLGLIFLEPMLLLFGATETNMPYAKDFAAIILIGAPFSAIGVAMSNMARVDGSPRLSMYSVLLGALLNLILNPIYIFVFHWGVRGSAIATITSQLLTAAITTVYFLKRGKNMRLKFSSFKIDFQAWRQVCAFGFSAAITQASFTLMQTIMNNSLVHYGNLDPLVGGDVALSAMGIVLKIMFIIVGLGLGIGIGSQPIFGFNHGANEPGRIKRCYYLAVGASTILMLLTSMLCQIFPYQLISIFGSRHSGFTDFAVECLRLYTLLTVLSGFQSVSTQYFQATGQPVKASILSSLRQLTMLVPAILILPLFFGLRGILFAGPVADAGSAVIVFFFIRAEMKKINRSIAAGDPLPAGEAVSNLGGI